METPSPNLESFVRTALSLHGITMPSPDIVETKKNLEALSQHWANYRRLAVDDSDEIALLFRAYPKTSD